MRNVGPRVSVLMPTYNSACYLPEAIQSILAQTYIDFELVIVDDCSTDETPQILSYFAQNDDRICTVRNSENLGRGGARNRALEARQCCEYIAIMDSDDISLPDRLEKQVSFLEAHPDTVAVGTQVLNIDEQGNPTSEQTCLPHTHGSLAWTMTYSVPFCNPSVMMRTDAVRVLGGYQESSPVEDAEFWTRLVHTGRFANLDEILLHYRMPSQRLIRRMAEWDLPIREVARSFVERLVGVSIDSSTRDCLRYSVFHNPDLRLSRNQTLKTIFLIQDAFEGMEAQGLLREEDIPEVADTMINQFRMLLSYPQV